MSNSSTTSAAGNGDTPSSSMSASTIVAGTVTGSHVLKIEGYSRTKGLGVGNRINSGTFNVGGHAWIISYYPDGCGSGNDDWISIYLFLHDHNTDAKDVKAQFRPSLLDQDGKPVPSYSKACDKIGAFSSKLGWGYSRFIERKVLEESTYLRDDCFSIRCGVTVNKEIRTEAAAAAAQFVVVPPSDLRRHLLDLLTSKQGVDVTFEVGGELFAAHRYMLAARSSVFMAELLGPMKEKTAARVRIDDMEPRVFKAMLHFIYADSLPEMDEGDDTVVMAQHLLVAADRYDLERLKLMCEEKLCNYIDTSMVATTLALAEQHSCNGLKEACFEFLKSPGNLKEVMASDGFEHLMSSFPSLLKELVAP